MANASFKGGKCSVMAGVNSDVKTVIAKQHVTHITVLPYGLSVQCTFHYTSGEDTVAIMDEADAERVLSWFTNKNKE